MKLTTRGRYAVTALLDIAIHASVLPTKIGQIAKRHDISETYLERLAGLMCNAGLLKSVRGPKGGYLLAKDADKITIADVIQSVEELMDATRCGGKANCQQGKMCLTHHLWEDLNQEIFRFLKGITLAQLAQKPALKAIASRQKVNLQYAGLE